DCAVTDACSVTCSRRTRSCSGKSCGSAAVGRVANALPARTSSKPAPVAAKPTQRRTDRNALAALGMTIGTPSRATSAPTVYVADSLRRYELHSVGVSHRDRSRRDWECVPPVHLSPVSAPPKPPVLRPPPPEGAP